MGAEAGNYKGVMLCNRPTEPSGRAGGPGQQHLTPQIDAPSFRPVGLPAEPLGLNPAKENLVSNVVAVHEEAARRRMTEPQPPGPPNVLNKHRTWLAEMARKKAHLNAELQASAEAAMTKRTKFVAYTKSLRAAVSARQAELAAGKGEAKPTAAAVPAEDDAVPAPPAKTAAKAVSSKPRWALTEEKADAVEDEEAEALVDFANGLDYESYIDDLEVRQALSVIRERIDQEKAMQAVAEAAEEAAAAVEDAGGNWRDAFLASWNGDADDALERGSRSSAPARHVGGAAGETAEKPDWDTSTATGDAQKAVSEGARQMAEELLKSNPGLAAKHSVRSLAAVVDASKKPQDAVADEIANLPPLKIVTVHENPRVKERSLDPSNLPYLHRNPAI